MEKSMVLMFIKFFDECIISKRIKRAKIWLYFITLLLFVIFCGVFTGVVKGVAGKNLPDSATVCMSIIFGSLLIMTIYFRESMATIFLFPNEYFLMKSIKAYLGKIFRDIYLSDIDGSKVTKHIRTLSYYIANLYDLQRIKSQNSIIISYKISELACDEFLYFINNKLKFNENYEYRLQDLTSEQIAEIMFSSFYTERIEKDSEINEELNAFLNSKFGKNFIKENVVYASSTFDDYRSDEWWLYNKRNLPVIEHDPFYRRHIKNNNKEFYNKKATDSKKNKEDKSYLSWIDNI